MLLMVAACSFLAAQINPRPVHETVRHQRRSHCGDSMREAQLRNADVAAWELWRNRLATMGAVMVLFWKHHHELLVRDKRIGIVIAVWAYLAGAR